MGLQQWDRPKSRRSQSSADTPDLREYDIALNAIEIGFISALLRIDGRKESRRLANKLLEQYDWMANQEGSHKK